MKKCLLFLLSFSAVYASALSIEVGPRSPNSTYGPRSFDSGGEATKILNPRRSPYGDSSVGQLGSRTSVGTQELMESLGSSLPEEPFWNERSIISFFRKHLDSTNDQGELTFETRINNLVADLTEVSSPRSIIFSRQVIDNFVLIVFTEYSDKLKFPLSGIARETSIQNTLALDDPQFEMLCQALAEAFPRFSAKELRM